MNELILDGSIMHLYFTILVHEEAQIGPRRCLGVNDTQVLTVTHLNILMNPRKCLYSYQSYQITN